MPTHSKRRPTLECILGGCGHHKHMLTFPVWPMLPEETRPFSDPAFIFEIKWDGIRCLVHNGEHAPHPREAAPHPGEPAAHHWKTSALPAVLQSRNGTDMTASFPEFRDLASCLPPRTILDGELICLAPNGRPDFELIMRRFHAGHPGTVARLVRETPAVLQVFDILQIEGRELISLPLESRKETLLRLQGAGLPPNIQITPWVEGEGERLFAEACRLELEGVVGKRLGSPYEPGKRSFNWRKCKNYRTYVTTILGFRHHPFTLLVGDPPRTVRGGLEHSIPREVRSFITALSHRFTCEREGAATGRMKGATAGRIRGATTWLEPVLRCEVRTSGVTWAGRFREPFFIRLLEPRAPGRPAEEPDEQEPLSRTQPLKRV